MKKIINKAGLWAVGIIGFILLMYVAFFAISVIPAIIFSPFVIFEIIKEGGWSEISLWGKLVIICGGLIFVGIVVKEFLLLIRRIKK